MDKKLLIFLFTVILVLSGSSVVYASDESWSGRLSILTTEIDNNRIGEGIEFTQNTLLRLINEGDFGDENKYEFHLLGSFTLSSDDTLFATPMVPWDQRYRIADLTLEMLSENNLSSFWTVDRLNARFTLPKADITIGRQAISFGKAWFWNPLDVFLPFSAGSVDRDYKAGVDALRIDIPTGDFSGVNFIAAAGRKMDFNNMLQRGNDPDTDWYGSALLMRYYTTIQGWDFAMQGGKVYGGYQAGGGLVGEIGDYMVRAEASYFFAENSPVLYFPDKPFNVYENHLDFVLGIGRYYVNNMNFDIEYFHNGGASSINNSILWAKLNAGGINHISKDLIGFNMTCDFHPLLKGQLMTIFSLTDNSCMIQPNINYSVTDNSDFLLGAAFNFGKTTELTTYPYALQSEFGSYPNVIYAEYKYFF